MRVPVLRAGLSACLALTLWSSAAAQWPVGSRVLETPHNLTRPASSPDPDMAGLIANYDQACVYCHAPHGGDTRQPLWNRPVPPGPYRMNTDGRMPQAAQPAGGSLICLSCHDGTVGLDMIRVPPNGYAGPGPWGTTIDDCEGCHSGGSPAGGIDWEGVWLDTDLRQQHPISVLYDPGGDPAFRSAAEVLAAGLKLYAGRVECLSCHEPHTQQHRPFLRISNVGGSLCLACHTATPAETTAHHW